MNLVDLVFTPALELAKLIHSGEISPLELTEIYLERIQLLNPKLGSYVTVMAEQAIETAKIKTDLLGNKKDLPLLFGLPIPIKDLNPLAGVSCSFGNAVLQKNHIPTYDDAVILKIKEAGMIPIGKTATSELGSFPYTESKGLPPARNPWNLEYTPGGSSGGAAAAVAAGLAPFAHGSDGGGSIRGPAACCGIVGIKPSRGRISNAPGGDRFCGVATNGPLARTVADAAALLDVMSGYVNGDPYWLPEPESSFLAATQVQPVQLKIAFATNVPPFGKVDANCELGVLQTVKFLEELGHIVEEKCPDFSDLVQPFQIIWQSGTAASGIPVEILQPMNQWLFQQNYSATEYLNAVFQMQIAARKIISFFDTVDVLVLPVYRHSPIRVGEWSNLSPEETFEKIVNWVAPCPPVNATGQPAIALPVDLDSNGLPIGVQLVGKPAAESTLIALATQLEMVNPWLKRRPKLYASDSQSIIVK